MKHCDNCNESFDTDEVKRPVCGNDMHGVPDDDLSTEETVSSMTITGIL